MSWLEWMLCISVVLGTLTMLGGAAGMVLFVVWVTSH